jgi:hypothetical protein
VLSARRAAAEGRVVRIGNVPFDLCEWREEELAAKLAAGAAGAAGVPGAAVAPGAMGAKGASSTQ